MKQLMANDEWVLFVMALTNVDVLFIVNIFII